MLLGLRNDASIDAVRLANMGILHSLALSVQLQGTFVTWDRAISVGMLYLILIRATKLTIEERIKETVEIEPLGRVDEGKARCRSKKVRGWKERWADEGEV